VPSLHVQHHPTDHCIEESVHCRPESVPLHPPGTQSWCVSLVTVQQFLSVPNPDIWLSTAAAILVDAGSRGMAIPCPLLTKWQLPFAITSCTTCSAAAQRQSDGCSANCIDMQCRSQDLSLTAVTPHHALRDTTRPPPARRSAQSALAAAFSRSVASCAARLAVRRHEGCLTRSDQRLPCDCA
jgi:hypothetical protein